MRPGFNLSCIFIFLFYFSPCSAGCPKGWIQNKEKCYFFGRDNFNFATAASYCKVLGGKLAEPMSPAEKQFLDHETSIVARHEWFYIGATDMFTENEYVFLSTLNPVPSDVLNWAPGQPSHSKGENCAIINLAHHNGWDDLSCTVAGNFICERSIEVEIGSIIVG